MKMEKNKTLTEFAEQQHEREPKKQLLETIRIETTPFTAIKEPIGKDDEAIWSLTMGRYKLQSGFKTFDEVEQNAFNTSWDRIVQVITICIEAHKQIELNQK